MMAKDIQKEDFQGSCCLDNLQQTDLNETVCLNGSGFSGLAWTLKFVTK